MPGVSQWDPVRALAAFAFSDLGREGFHPICEAEAARVQLATSDMLPMRLRRGDSRTAANKQIILWAAARFSWICPGPSRICCYSAPGQLLGGNEASHFLTELGSEFRESRWTRAASASQKRQIRLRAESSQGNSGPAVPVCASESANGGATGRPQGRSSLRTDVAQIRPTSELRRIKAQRQTHPSAKLSCAKRRFRQRQTHPAPSSPLKKIRPLPRQGPTIALVRALV